MEVKEILKELRKKNGFVRAVDFCEASGISYNTYQNYESGKRIPTADILIQIADFYEVSVDSLLGREVPEPEIKPPPDMEKVAISVEEFVKRLDGLRPEHQKILMKCINDIHDTMFNDDGTIKPDNAVYRTLTAEQKAKEAAENKAAELAGAV